MTWKQQPAANSYEALAKVACGLDLPAFAYIAIPSAVGRQLRLISNYFDHRRRHYVAQRYETCDPIVLRASVTRTPFEWGPEFGNDSPFTKRFFDEAASFGILYGYKIPIRHRRGRFAALTFATGGSRVAFFRAIRRNALALQLISYQFHLHVREKLEPLQFIVGIHLTFREQQCLSLVAEGKPYPDIALVLGIAPRTVKDYVDSAKSMLGVRTAREAAQLLQAVRRKR